MDNIRDRAVGRVKKAAGDLAGDPGLRRDGTKDEKKADAKDKLDDAKEKAKNKAEEVADLEKES